MDDSKREKDLKKKYILRTFPITFTTEISFSNNVKTPTQANKEQIINQAFKFHSQGNISEATKYYQYCIKQGFNDHRVFSNYGTILKSLGKLQEAELSTRKAIEIKPDYADAYLNLGNI